MISVVIPLYNKEKQIGQTLQSVLSQTFQDFEIVIVNDGSTDSSVAKVEEINDSRIRLINQSNAGVSAARNRGINEAKGKYVAFIDADDEWKPDYLETQLMLANKYPECEAFATNYEFRNTTGVTSPTKINNIPFKGEDGILSNYFEVAASSHPPICSISIMATKDALMAIGGFPVGIKSGEDLLTWARLACHYKIAYTRHTAATFIESESDSATSKAVQRSGGEQKVLDSLLELYKTYQNVIGLRDYIIRWYKIYCVLLIEIGDNHRILSLSREAIRFGGQKSTFLLLYILGLLPSGLAKYIFFKLRR